MVGSSLLSSARIRNSETGDRERERENKGSKWMGNCMPKKLKSSLPFPNLLKDTSGAAKQRKVAGTL